MYLRKAKFYVLRPFQQTSKVEIIYLAFESLKIGTKKAQK